MTVRDRVEAALKECIQEILENAAEHVRRNVKTQTHAEAYAKDACLAALSQFTRDLLR